MRQRLLVTGMVLLAACSPQASSAGDYILREGAIDGSSRLSVSNAGTIQIQNTGEYAHTLVVTDETGQVIAATGLVDPGAQTSLQVDLEEGTYVFSCRIVSQDGDGNLIDHFEQGMHQTVAVQG
jgi:methionine-rich copper-binding protein CopC